MRTNVTLPAGGRLAPMSFRAWLQAEFARRCARNPRYSLRAFARQAGTDHSTLSQILRGRRRVTPAAVDKIGRRLGMDESTLQSYVTREVHLAAMPAVPLDEVQQLTRDAANLISDWYHYALLELVRLKEFRADVRWISRVLGITPDEVNVALTRLLRLGLVEMKGGRWVDRSAATTATLEDFTATAVQHLSEQVRQLFLTALSNVPTDARETSSTTIAISTARLAGAIERIARFRRELVQYLEQDTERDDVYQLEVNFFPLTTLKQLNANPKENPDGTTGDAVPDPGPKPRARR